MTSPTKEKQAMPIHNKESRQRYLKFVNGGELDSCIATNIEEACELLGQKHYSRISDRSAICMANPGQSIEIHLEANAFDWAWDEGRRDFHRGECESANPYAPNTRQHECWADGWADGYEDSEIASKAVH